MGLICHKDKNCKDWKRKMLNIILVIKCVIFDRVSWCKCNIVYKCVTIILANKLKSCSNEIIGQCKVGI